MSPCRSTVPRFRSMVAVTVIELIIAVAILAILVSIAAPSFREISLRNRSSTATNSLLADLALARNEAVKSARTAYVEARGDWSEGWFVWVDADGDGRRGGDEPILRQQGPVDSPEVHARSAFVLSAVSGTNGAGTDLARVGFAPLGQIREPNNGARFALCRPDGDVAKSIGVRLDLSGRAESVRDLRMLNLGCDG